MTATIPDQAGAPRQDVENSILAREATLAALDRPRRSQRPAVESAQGRGTAHRAIANVLGEPLGTVGSWIGLGAAKLRAHLDAADAARSPPVARGGPVA